MIPIYIPSKGKFAPGATPTTNLLKAGGRDYTIFVDSIEADGLGIGYARRFIQAYADRRNSLISWVLDDDILNLYRLPADQAIRPEAGGAAILTEAEDSILIEKFIDLTPPVAVAHFEFMESVARNPEEFTFAKVPIMAVLIIWDRIREAKAEYDPAILLHHDVDFAFQLYRAGFSTAQFNRFAMRVRPSNSNYTHPAYFDDSERMVKKWPEWCKIIPNLKTNYTGALEVPVGRRIRLQRNHNQWKKHLGVTDRKNETMEEPTPLSNGSNGKIRSYLCPTGKRRRRCTEFAFNPDWDGTLSSNARARRTDPSESHDAAFTVDASADIVKVREYVDVLLARNQGVVISKEVNEYVDAELKAGRIPAGKEPPHVRAESIRRRFCDLT
jgi:hypothetical protein